MATLFKALEPRLNLSDAQKRKLSEGSPLFRLLPPGSVDLRKKPSKRQTRREVIGSRGVLAQTGDGAVTRKTLLGS